MTADQHRRPARGPLRRALLALLALVPGAARAQGSSSRSATPSSDEATRNYWTQERMRNATPAMPTVDLPRETGRATPPPQGPSVSSPGAPPSASAQQRGQGGR